jgi:hypothetical protein
MRRNERGGTTIEMLVMLPIAVFVVQGMLVLFGANMARQQTYASCPEVARRTWTGSTPSTFAPTGRSVCRIENLSVNNDSGLFIFEEVPCWFAVPYRPYFPTKDLVRTRFNANTDYVAPTVPGLSPRTRTRTRYSETGLKD